MKSFKNNKKQLFFIVVSIFVTACSAIAPSSQQSLSQPSCKENCALLEVSAPEIALEGMFGNIWDVLPAEYQLLEQYREHPQILAQVENYKRNPHYFKVISERSERYIHFVLENIRERGMPTELVLLPVVESAYDPFAYSHGRASGLWQFVPVTARHIGLRQSWWYDGRRDVISSTIGALDYLEYLNQRFDGDWLLTLAAYNSGPGTVSRAISRNSSRGLPTDYWSLPLPRETREYVPKLLALSYMVEKATEKQLPLHPIPLQPYFEVVETGGQIDLAQAAKLASVSIDEIYRLNPGFNRWATDPEGPHRLLVPADSATLFLAQLEEVPQEQRMSWELYQVQPGDSLIRIARNFNTDISTIRAANDLDGNLIRVGQTLLMPSARLDSGDYSLSQEQRLAAAQARGGQAGRQRQDYIVRSGDSLWAIARRHGVSVDAIARWNNMAPRDPIRPGQSLTLWTTASTTAASNPTISREVIRRVGYTVRRGDSLARIAGRFNVAVSDIVEWNTINPAQYLQPGQRLTLFVDVTKVSQLSP